ncbi:heme-binding protein [Roseimicrobium sp. ORNL1]|uniref:heme-binding protein n=1 Tax=Roseimicrobium sp. ORNL1 TaxID=2711231 RepID=UPI0013E1DF98|nr:heme-binding protein [Roseimicrobium sp. ORNL1]QIF03219.1 heme-binding protein [Roseimicrobium sp. ORNL1]
MARQLAHGFAFIFTTIVAVAASSAQLANQPPAPAWLNGSSKYEVKFDHEGKLLMGVLFVAADKEVEVKLNGVQVGIAKDATKAVSLDVTRYVGLGANTVILQSKDGSPAKVAALMELNGDLAARRWVYSDESWSTPQGKATTAGLIDADPATDPFNFKQTFDAYNSWQLAKRDQQSQATDPSTFKLPPGFKVELIRSALPEEGSWVAMTFDPKGRAILAMEKKGLLRVDPDGKTQVIEDTLLECRGLLYARGYLYAHANNTKALYRLRDVDGDGVLEEKQELMRTEGGVGHGRNHIKAGPGGSIWVVNGNNVLLPSPLAPSSPLRNYSSDQPLPNPWDSVMFDGTVELPAGHVLQVSPTGDKVELMAGGLRNALDIAFNRDGELFTFDADMERDVGASWYMPTRVLHVVSGADFGWRRGTGRYPAWYADTHPSVVDIGLSSPTAIFFGYGGKIPAKYQEALFICDWSYGRIIAVHLKPDGASYKGEQETFITGRPLNVTDGCIGPDGALWFTTGGRGTQSGLYRITYSGKIDHTAPSGDSEQLRDLRHALEAYHGGIPDGLQQRALIRSWDSLGHEDRFIRHAARLALEQLPVLLWKAKAVEDPNPGSWRHITALLALVRSGDASLFAEVMESLERIPRDTLDEERRLAVLRAMGVALARWGEPEEGMRARLAAMLEPQYPADSFPLNQELCRLLIRLKSPSVLEKSVKLVSVANSSEELLFYPMHLRYLKDGWNIASRRTVFEALNRAEKFNGASAYFKAIQDTRNELAAALPPAEALELASIIHPAKPVVLAPHAMPGHTFKAWKLEDLEAKLTQVGQGRSFEKGRAAAISAQCVFCHKMSNDTTLPAGVFGPELVQVSARFSRRDLLDHILNPSKVIDEKYLFVTITKNDGSQVTGSVEGEDDERVTLKPNPLSPETVEVGKTLIKKREVSTVSPMPVGLVNGLRMEQLLDLLAFIEAGGDPSHINFKTAIPAP